MAEAATTPQDQEAQAFVDRVKQTLGPVWEELSTAEQDTLMREEAQKSLAGGRGGTISFTEPQGPLPDYTYDPQTGKPDTLQSEPMAELRDPGAAATSRWPQTKKDLAPMLGSAGGTALGYQLGGMPGAAIGDTLGTGLGLGANIALGVEPWDPWRASALLGPTLVNALGAGRKLAGQFAGTTGVGKKAALAAEQSPTQSLNAAHQATYEHAVALQEQFMARAEAQYAEDVQSYQAVVDLQTENQRQVTAYIRQQNALRAESRAQDPRLALVQQGRNTELAARYVKSLPNVPTDAEVREAYTAAQETARARTMPGPGGTPVPVPMETPLVDAVRKEVLALADSVAKSPGGAPVAERLRRSVTLQGGEPVNLGDLNDIEKWLRAHVAALRRSSAESASTDLHTASRLLTAYSATLDKLAESDGVASQFQGLLKLARAKALKNLTAAELGDFLSPKGLFTAQPGNHWKFDATQGLQQLESDAYESMRFFMRKTVFGPEDGPEWAGKNLYDVTKDTLTRMSKLGLTLKQQANLTAMEGGPVAGRVLPPMPGYVAPPPPPFKPVAPTDPSMMNQTRIGGWSPKPLPTADVRPDMPSVLARWGTRLAGLSGGVAMAMGGANYTPSRIIGTSVGVLGPTVLTEIFSTPWGQRQLVKLMEAQGPYLTPGFMGFLAAAAHSAAPTPPSAPGGGPGQ